MKKETSSFKPRRIVVTLGACLALLPALSAAQEAATRGESITVTGSRLVRVDEETSLPVTVITRKDIESTGQATVAEVLRTLTYNSQGSSIPVVGSTGQNVTDVNLRGLGFGRTLVLINGRRVPVDSSFFGFAVSTQNIPIGAIDRIEVLREGASAIYGSDAIGGVVNIILRRDYVGAEAMIEYTDPKGSGGSTTVYGATAGWRGDKGGFMVAAEHRTADRISRAERPYMASDFSNLGFGFVSNSFPPTYRATDFFGNGSNVAGPLTAATGCSSDLVRTSPGLTLKDPVTGNQVTTGPQTECRNPTGNKTDFGPKFDVDTIYATGHWSITKDLSLFLEGMYSRQDSSGFSAPVTTSNSVSATNPTNPTRNATAANPVAGVTGPRPLSVLFALPDPYERDLQSSSKYQNLVAGVDWSPTAGDLKAYYQASKQYADNLYTNALRTGTFNAAVASGALDLFSTSSPDRFAQFVTTGTRYTESKLDAAGINWAATLPGFQLPGGGIRYSAGYEWRRESLIETCDALTAVFALNGAFCFQRPRAERDVNAYYIETALPVTKELELDYAGRYDNYSVPDVGKWTNRIAFRYQAIPAVLLRGSYSEGFRAPNLFEISSASGTATTTVIDTRGCAAAGGNPASPACQPISVTQTIKGGPNLKPEESESPSIGVVWSPRRDFNLSVDYYQVKVKNQIANLDNQTVVNLEAQGLDLAAYGVSVTRDASGTITAVTSGSTNVPGFRTSGVDVESNFLADFKDYGRLRSRFLATWVREYKRPSAPGSPVLDAVGYVNVPEWLASWTNTWTRGPWSADLRWNYVDGFDARTPEQKQLLHVADQGHIASYSTADLFVRYTFSWKGTLSIGARNIFDKLPSLNRFAYGDFGYSRPLADVNGRVLVASYTQTFKWW